MAFKKNSSLKKNFDNAITAGLVALIIGGEAAVIMAGMAVEPLRITVEGKHQEPMRRGEGFALTKTVYDTDKGKFANTDASFNDKAKRDRIDREIQVGQTYDVTVRGIPLPVVNVYKNILTAKPVLPGSKP